MESESFSLDFGDNGGFGAFFGGFVMPILLEDRQLSVYLAGPLTNNDPGINQECKGVRALVRRILESYDLDGITIGVYDPADVTQPNSAHSAEEVYEMDHHRTMTADLVVFHVNVPSLGVGCESQIAADATVPRITLSKKGSPVSRMFTGIFSPAIAAIEYESLSDLEIRLSAVLPDVMRKTVKSARRRRPIVANFEQLNLSKFIFKQRIIHGISLETLAEQTDIRVHWLRRLERNPGLAICITAIQFHRIADVVQSRVDLTSGLPSMRQTEDQLNSAQNESLENLVRHVLSHKDWVPDSKLLSRWSDFIEESELAQQHRNNKGPIVTEEEWKKRLEGGLF